MEVSFIGGENECPDLSQATDKLDHIMLYQVHLDEFITFSGCTDSCNSSYMYMYHTITITMAAVALGKEITGIYLCIDS